MTPDTFNKRNLFRFKKTPIEVAERPRSTNTEQKEKTNNKLRKNIL